MNNRKGKKLKKNILKHGFYLKLSNFHFFNHEINISKRILTLFQKKKKKKKKKED